MRCTVLLFCLCAEPRVRCTVLLFCLCAEPRVRCTVLLFCLCAEPRVRCTVLLFCLCAEPSLIHSILGNRQFVIFMVTLLVTLPLSLYRNIGKLGKVICSDHNIYWQSALLIIKVKWASQFARAL